MKKNDYIFWFFYCRGRLLLHIRKKHGKEIDHLVEKPENFSCKECGKKFRTIRYLIKHSNRMHVDKVKSVNTKKTKKKKVKQIKKEILKKDETMDNDNNDEQNDNDVQEAVVKEMAGEVDDSAVKKTCQKFECTLNGCSMTFKEKYVFNIL